MSDELKPCPMCGGAADVHEMEDYFMAACECGVCYEGPTAADCVTAWNRRTAPVSAPIVEELPAPDVIAYTCIGDNDAYSPQLVKQIVAKRAERIRQLERELSKMVQ